MFGRVFSAFLAALRAIIRGLRRVFNEAGPELAPNAGDGVGAAAAAPLLSSTYWTQITEPLPNSAPLPGSAPTAKLRLPDGVFAGTRKVTT